MKLHKKIGLTSLTFGLLVFATSASATLYDFAGLANTSPGEGGYTSLIVGANGQVQGAATGITVTATATYDDAGTTKDAFAYLDGKSGGLDGGLGVAKVLNGPGDGTGQATPSSDDNLSDTEILNLVFSQAVTLDSIIFRNAGHGTTFSGDFFVSIDGGVFVAYTLTHLFTTNLTGTEFDFAVDTDSYYISSFETPEPGTLIMMGLALGLMGFSRRKSA